MSKIIKIFIFLVVALAAFNKQILSYFLIYGFSNWTERKITVDTIKINYGKNSLKIHGLKVKNHGKFFFKDIQIKDEPQGSIDTSFANRELSVKGTPEWVNL